MTTGRTATRRLHLTGLVQGVGFRPFVYREAVHRNLHGWVRNTPSGVDIVVQGTSPDVEDFIDALRSNAPPSSRIDTFETIEEDGATAFVAFDILPSTDDGAREASLLPDLATCPDCLRELRDPSNRRFRYPFINCTHCGPRYSILHRLPYDRPNTTMRSFTMCPECRREYEDPLDRRFHAQPIACPACGPSLALRDKLGRTLATHDDALLEAAQGLRNGGIVAVKGIGGFHLMCDALNEKAVHTLRTRKHRAEKPFAVMMTDVRMVSAYAQVSDEERAALCSSAAPIVLLRKRATAVSGALAASIAPGQSCLGILLPYAPLHHLLMDEVQRPLVATSGNLSDEPICTDEHEAVARLGGIADYFLVHDRPIAHPVDDSVTRVVLGRPLRLRVARGWAPLSLPRPGGTTGEPILAVGPHMKSTLALTTRHHVVVSPHIGDLETIPAWEAFERNLETLQGLYDVAPTRVACDRHPEYASTRYALRRNPDALPVQHHHAHLLAVMAEHALEGPVLGFALDGTGYGDDGTIWGGEAMRVDRDGYRRVAHLRSFPLPGGDAAAREPRRAALGLLHAMASPEGASDALDIPANERRVLQTMIQRRINTVTTTSAGRLFDAVSALLGLGGFSSFEGQAAMRLQAEAEQAETAAGAYPVLLHDGLPLCIDWEPCIRALLDDRHRGEATAVIAMRFHQWFADSLLDVARRHPGLPVVLGGGCFQNALLLERTVSSLRRHGRVVYWPRLLPPNDGAIAVGQVLAAAWRSGA